MVGTTGLLGLCQIASRLVRFADSAFSARVAGSVKPASRFKSSVEALLV